MGVIKGKDLVDESITLGKLSPDVQDRLIVHSKVVGADLSATGATVSRTFDGITATATNNGDFFKLEFTSETELPNCCVVRTVYSGSGTGSTSQVTTLGSTPFSFPDLTTGASPRVEFELSVPSTGAIYHLHAFANAAPSGGWTNANAYVEKM